MLISKLCIFKDFLKLSNLHFISLLQFSKAKPSHESIEHCSIFDTYFNIICDDIGMCFKLTTNIKPRTIQEKSIIM